MSLNKEIDHGDNSIDGKISTRMDILSVTDNNTIISTTNAIVAQDNIQTFPCVPIQTK